MISINFNCFNIMFLVIWLAWKKVEFKYFLQHRITSIFNIMWWSSYFQTFSEIFDRKLIKSKIFGKNWFLSILTVSILCFLSFGWIEKKVEFNYFLQHRIPSIFNVMWWSTSLQTFSDIFSFDRKWSKVFDKNIFVWILTVKILSFLPFGWLEK